MRASLALLTAALQRHVHLRVGLGDNAGLFPTWTNANMTEYAVELACRHDLQPVTADELRMRAHLA